MQHTVLFLYVICDIWSDWTNCLGNCFCSLEIRGKEKNILARTSILQSLNFSISNVVTTMATVVTFILHIYSGNDLMASQVGCELRHIALARFLLNRTVRANRKFARKGWTASQFRQPIKSVNSLFHFASRTWKTCFRLIISKL